MVRMMLRKLMWAHASGKVNPLIKACERTVRIRKQTHGTQQEAVVGVNNGFGCINNNQTWTCLDRRLPENLLDCALQQWRPLQGLLRFTISLSPGCSHLLPHPLLHLRVSAEFKQSKLQRDCCLHMGWTLQALIYIYRVILQLCC